MPVRHTYDKDTAGATSEQGLPQWNLSDLYPGPNSPELATDLAEIKKTAHTFAKTYQGQVATLNAPAFGQAIAAYDQLSERLCRAASYAQLLQAENVSDPEVGRCVQGIIEKSIDVQTVILFFPLEISQIDEATLEQKMQDPGSAHYAPWIRDVRLTKDYQLSDELERLCSEKNITGAHAWIRLFDETIATLRFPINGTDLTLTEATHLLGEADPEARKSAAKSIGHVLEKHVRLFGLVTNTLAKDKEIDDRLRGYPTPIAARNLANQVEDNIVEALVTAVKDAFPRLSHRYYAMKAAWFGTSHLNYWDRNAPIPGETPRTWGWQEAVELVLDSYGRFSPELAQVARRFFDNPWIDVPARPGKASGAFAHPTVPTVHPYLLLNFMGKSRDVMTLAHELGHGCHQILAAQHGCLMSDTPLTLAETASVFGEMLTFRAMLDAETQPERRRVLLASKVEDMLNTVVRQIAFHEFERRLHHERRASGEVPTERIGEIWIQTQIESLGPALRFDSEYQYYWAYIPHFIHSPFYVYAYAFGDCLVNSLYQVYEQGLPGFQGKYLDMLAAGGTLRHQELLQPFGLDATDPNFWKKGLNIIEGFIDELERL